MRDHIFKPIVQINEYRNRNNDKNKLLYNCKAHRSGYYDGRQGIYTLGPYIKAIFSLLFETAKDAKLLQ